MSALQSQVNEFIRLLKEADAASIPLHNLDAEDDFEVSPEQFSDLLTINELLKRYPSRIITIAKVKSIDPENGWKLCNVKGSLGETGKCVICSASYVHNEKTVKVKTLDNSIPQSVCRKCCQDHAPEEFTYTDGYSEWINATSDNDRKLIGTNSKEEQEKVCVLEAIRDHLVETHYYHEIAAKVPEYSRDLCDEVN